MVIKAIVISTYIVAISYLVTVVVYLYRFILHPPERKSKKGTDESEDYAEPLGNPLFPSLFLKAMANLQNAESSAFLNHWAHHLKGSCVTLGASMLRFEKGQGDPSLSSL